MFLLQTVKQIQHLRLDRYIQRRHRFVADDNLGIHGKRPGYIDSLALTAGKFMGEAMNMLDIQPHLPHQLQHPLLPFLLIRDQVVDNQGFLNQLSCRLAGIQRRIGVLENHLNIFFHLL